MKKIQLSQNKKSIIDDEDYERLNQWKWSFHNGGYGVRTTWPDNKAVLLHRIVMNCPDNMEVDHINGNKLDNRKENLRVCTARENRLNRKKSKNKTSKYKGVHWNKDNSKWRAKITVNDKSISLGCFITELEAAEAYNKSALTYFGKYAKLNKLKGE